MTIDMTGKTFARLTVVREVAPTRYKSMSVRRFLFLCECGVTKEIDGHVVRNGLVSSCGCNRDGKWNLKHGHARQAARTAEYMCWKHIIQRCENPNNKRYEDYGGRGISICKRWRESYETFFADMGQKPTRTHSIDRIDNDGNYEPSNCRWATPEEQRINQRKRRFWKRPVSLENKTARP